MTDTRTRRRSRLDRAEQHLYTAREVDKTAYLPNEEPDGENIYTPNEVWAEEPVYTPNEYEQDYTPNEPDAQETVYTPNEPDYTAYYSREAVEQEAVESAFAPPPSMQQYVVDVQDWQEEPAQEDDYAANNVYRPRMVTWAEEDRDEAIAESELGYQVQEDAPAPRRKKKKHTLRNVLTALLILVLLAGIAWILQDEIKSMLGMEDAAPVNAQETVQVFVTPEPIKAYDAAPSAQVADAARTTISQLSGTLDMDMYLTTDSHVVTRNQRADGSFDFYLFTAEGRLLCYFEGLEARDMMPQAFGGFYVAQSPWLVKPNGSALIRTSDVEAAIGESVFLHPMYNGWAVVESEVDGHANYVNAEGKLMSSLWFSRTFPFTGEQTLAYVDTGSTAGADDRYLLYVLGRDGAMTRWFSAGNMEDVVASVNGMAYMKDGRLYHLPDTEKPIVTSAEIIAYPDCDAMVIQDPATGKYGLFVDGEQHYAYAYDAIHPLESELTWVEKTLGQDGARMTIRTVAADAYPLPLSHSFVLEKNGQQEYVALSTKSSYPIRLDGEF